MKNVAAKYALPAAGLALGAAPAAWAHHAMDYALPITAQQGLLSGLAHPILGIDHLLFVLAVGVACYYFAPRVQTLLAFLLATVAGTAVHLYGATFIFTEVWIAFTLIMLGILLIAARALLASRIAPLLFAGAGLVHGYGYGEAITGAGAAPLFTYLAGYTIMQLIVIGAGYGIAAYADSRKPRETVVRTTSGGLLAAGTAFLVLAL